MIGNTRHVGLYSCGKKLKSYYKDGKELVDYNGKTYEVGCETCDNHDADSCCSCGLGMESYSLDTSSDVFSISKETEMTREEIFKKNFPQYVTEKGVYLSPFWDLFDAGFEAATSELAKNYQTSRLYLEGYDDAKKEFEKEITELKLRLQRTEMLLTSAEITAHNEGADKIALLKENKELKDTLGKVETEKNKLTNEAMYTESEVLNVMKLLKASCEGKTLQTPNGKGGWIDCNTENIIFYDLLRFEYRIKEEDKNERKY